MARRAWTSPPPEPTQEARRLCESLGWVGDEVFLTYNRRVQAPAVGRVL
jgi:hypothetical protein